MHRRILVGSVLVALSSWVAAAPPVSPSPAPSPAPAGGTITGTVVGPQGAPVAGAVVRVRATRSAPEARTVTAATGADGRFAVGSLAGEAFAVRVESKDHAPFYAPDVPPGAALRVTLRAGASLSGTVVDATTRKPLAGAEVRVHDAGAGTFGDEAARTARTGEDGAFTVPALAPGTARVEAVAPGRALEVLRTVTVPAPSRLEIGLRPGARLAGRVVGPDGKGIEGVDVGVGPSSGSVMGMIRGSGQGFHERTDDAGRFSFPGIPAGQGWRLQALKKGYTPGEAGPFSVQAGTDRADLEVRLTAPASLKVKLVDRRGDPVAGLEAEVRVRGAGPMRGSGQVPDQDVESKGEGVFVLRNLPSGTATVLLVPEGFVDVEREDLRLRPSETLDLGTVVVREGRTLSGRVSDPAGAPVAGASLDAFWNDGRAFRSRGTKSREDGTFRLAGLGEGPLAFLSVDAKGFAGERRETVPVTAEPLELVLRPAASLTGKVQLADGTAPPAFQVRAHRETGGTEERPGLRVRIGRGGEEDVRTDPGGGYTLEGLEPGTYTVEASAEGKAPARQKGVVAVSGEVRDVPALVLRDGQTVRGRVLDARDDTPLPGASVQVGRPSGPLTAMGELSLGRVTVTGADGAFAVKGVEAGAFAVSVEHPDFARADARVEVLEGEEPPETVVRLSRGGTLTGTVRDAQGTPVPGATILVMQGFNPAGMQRATTGEDGRYLIERLAPGTYQAMKAPEGGRVMIAAGFGMKTATIEEGGTTVLDFDDRPRVQLTGRITRGGRAVSGAQAVFFPGAAGAGTMPAGDMKTTQTDEDGRYAVGLEAGGTYTVLIGSLLPGGSSTRSTREIVVPEEPVAVVDIALPSGGIQGTVTDPDGKPVTQALVQVRAPGAEAGLGNASMTDGSGAFSFEALKPGTWTVSVQAPGFRAASRDVTLAGEEDRQRLDLQLEKGASLAGRVVDPQGNAVADAWVLAAPAGTGDLQSGMPAQTDVNGRFSITSPADGPVDLTAISASWAPAVASGVAPPSGEAPPEIVLQVGRGGRVRVRAVRDGAPAAGVPVAARPVVPFAGAQMLRFLRPPVPTGPDGVAVLDLLSPGGWEVVVSGKEAAGGVVVQVQEGGEAAVQLPAP